MKIKDILGEAGAVATIKDYKPGQSLSFTDQEGSTMTTIDLKKNPMAVKPDEQGNLTYDPTPDTQAATPGQSQAPEIKPGAQINIDTATTEGVESIENEVANIMKQFDEDMNEIGGYGMPDEDKIVELLKNGDIDSALDYVYGSYADQDGGELRNMDRYIQSLQDQFQDLVNAEDDKFRSNDPTDDLVSDTYGDEDEESEKKIPSRMDESAYITALAKRIVGTDAKVSKSANKSIADIRKLAGL